MGVMFEIYFTKSFVTKEEWSQFITIISSYNGVFKNWKIFVLISTNKIRYFVYTKCFLPPTINNLSSFVFKKTNHKNFPRISYSCPLVFYTEKNIIDLLEFCIVKRNERLQCIEFNFFCFSRQKIRWHIDLYFSTGKKRIRRSLLFGIPSFILAVDFSKNVRYLYKSITKYLDIGKNLSILSRDSLYSLFKIDTFPYLQGDFYLKQDSYQFDKHSIIVGASGSGKSKFISSFIYNLYKSDALTGKYKVVLIDPHASMEKDIGGIGKVIDFNNREDSIDLFINKKNDAVSSCELLLELFKSLLLDLYNSKLERVLRHSIYLLLMYEDFSFTSLRKLLLDVTFRTDLINELSDSLPHSVIAFFLNDFVELKNKYYTESISPIISFLDEMEMLPVFSNRVSDSNLGDVVIDNFFTLFSLDKTKLGDKVTRMIAGLVMQQLFTLAQSNSFSAHILFIVDEVATVENPILVRFLSEARKYHLSLIIVEQYFNQISSFLRDSIFANVVNYYIFRVSLGDANILVDNLKMKIAFSDSLEKRVKLLTELKNRECVIRISVKGVLLSAIKGTTLDFESIPRKNRVFNKDIYNKEENQQKMIDFQIGNVSLRKILEINSSSREEW